MIAALRGRTTVFFSTHILADVERVWTPWPCIDQRPRRGAVRHRRAAQPARGGLNRLIVEVDDPRRLWAGLAGRRMAAAGGRGRGRRAPRRPATTSRRRSASCPPWSPGSARAAPLRAPTSSPRGRLRRPRRGGDRDERLRAFLRKECARPSTPGGSGCSPASWSSRRYRSAGRQLTPTLLEASAAASRGSASPSPTDGADAYLQFLGNLGQMVLFASSSPAAASSPARARRNRGPRTHQAALARGFVIGQVVSQRC